MNIVEILEGLGFDWRVFAFNLINFIILMVILRNIVFKPVMKMLEERERIANENIALNEQLQTKDALAEAEKQKILDIADTQASEIIKAAAVRGKEIESEATAKANKNAEKIIEDAQKAAQAEKTEMLKQFKQEASEIVASVSNKVIEDASADYKVSLKNIDNLLDK